MRHRTLLALLGLVFAALIAATVLLAPQGREEPLPDVVQRIEPARDATVLRQTAIEIDLASGYTLELFVDGLRIPLDEIDTTPEISLFVWRPGAGRSLTEWAPGIHTVLMTWDTVAGLPDPGELRWRFRVQ